MNFGFLLLNDTFDSNPDRPAFQLETTSVSPGVGVAVITATANATFATVELIVQPPKSGVLPFAAITMALLSVVVRFIVR